jgi:integrase
MQSDRAKAQAVALEFERAAKLAKRDELTEARAREILTGILERVEVGNSVHGLSIQEHYRSVLDDIMVRADFGERLRTVSIKKCFSDWLDSKTDLAPASLVKYVQLSGCFLDSLGDRKSKPITALSVQDVRRFFNARAREKLAPRTLIDSVKLVSNVLNAARKEGLISSNPAEAVELPKAKGVERETFTPTEVKLLVDAANGEWKTTILLGYFTGARLLDCSRMTWDSVDLVTKTLTFTPRKTGKRIMVPIHPELEVHLNGLAGIDLPEKFITPGLARLKTGGQHGLSEGFKRIMEEAGVSARMVKGMGVRNQSKRAFHGLRHSFISALANEGVHEDMRMKLTGQTTKAVHRGYTHHEIETLRRGINQLPGLE